MYRDHEAPSREKLTALKDYLATFDLPFALGQVIKPAIFNRIIERLGEDHPLAARDHGADPAHPDAGPLCSRSAGPFRPEPGQLRAFHFTDPPAYADLIVHRSLVRSYKLGEGALGPDKVERFTEIGEKISLLERRAMEAERETVDRYVAAFLSDRVGQILKCRITGVQSFGFFATVLDLGRRRAGAGIDPRQ